MPRSILSDEVRTALSHYSIGALIDFAPLEGGEISTNLRVVTDQGNFFVRRRPQSYSESSIAFELGLVDHLISNGFPTAPLISTVAGKRGVVLGGCHWEVYRFVSGERYNARRLKQTQSAAILLSQFHVAAAGYIPQITNINDRRVDLESRIVWTANEFGRILRASFIGRLFGGVLLSYFDNEMAKVLSGYHLLRDFAPILIHADFHPGNIVFQEDKSSVLVDFGNATLFQRSYDVSRAMSCFAILKPSYSTNTDYMPHLDWNRASIFARTYQTYLPLKKNEIRATAALLRGSYLFDVVFFLRRQTHFVHKLSWLIHALRFTRWLDQYEDRIRSLFCLR